MIFADFFAVWFYRRHARWPDLLKLLPATLVGIVCGWWLMPHIPDRTFTVMLGWVVLGLMLLTVVQRLRPQAMAAMAGHPLLGLAAGWAAGVTTMLANAAGAIAAFYFLARRTDKMTFVPFSAQLGLITPSSLRFDALLLPVVIIGAAAGRLLLRHVPQRAFEWITIALAAAAAARLIAFP
jgi:uncharacterized membrane protein YfcA